MRHVSPLRYPGGKAALAGFLAQTISENNLSQCTYFEPFAGGAGAALRLLRDGAVSEVYLNDLDPHIHAFWKAALTEPARFAAAIHSVPLTITEWRRQRHIALNAHSNTAFDSGFATFYLNRCNRSGIIMGAAPIGGYEQAGHWRIDARFNREKLANRILQLAKAEKQIHISRMDALDFLVKHLPRGSKREQVFVYLDPPYYCNGKRLYMNAYQDGDHRRLAQYIQRQQTLKWIASYDDTAFIRRLYEPCVISDSTLQYSLQRKRPAKELLITPHHLKITELTDVTFS